MEDKITKASNALSNGERERARRLLNQVLREDTGNVKALWMMARLHESLGETEFWLETLNKLKETLPRELGVVDELARAYAKVRRLPDSVSLYRSYLDQHPDSTNARYNYAYYLSRAGEFNDSVKQYELLLEQDVEKPEEIYLNLAKIYCERGYQYETGRGHLETALTLNSDYAPAWFNLGNLHEQLGDLSEAKICFRKAADIDDGDGRALARIADLTRFDDDEEIELIGQMENKLEVKQPPNPDLMFSLGRAYEQTGQYEQSLHLYESANLIDWQYLPQYNKNSMTQFMERIAKSYTRKVETSHDSGVLGQLFICGNFRSGSTLLEQMLAAHSSFTAGGERGFFRFIASDPRVEYPSALTLNPDLLTEFADRYNTQTIELFGSDTRVTDKRPDNLILIGLIKQVLPDAKFIITRRDPRDVAWSIFTTRFGSSLTYATVMENILHFIGLQEELANHWSNVFKDDVIFISYESLIDDPKGELTQLLGKLGEGWEDACLDFKDLKNFVTTASSAQVRRSLNKKSIGRSEPFHEYLNKASINTL